MKMKMRRGEMEMRERGYKRNLVGLDWTGFN